MSKPLAIISAPIDTYSGYGARARDFIKALIKCDKYDVKILGQRWGNTRFGYLQDHNEIDLAQRMIPKIETKPKLWIQITVPNEFQPIGEYNIGVTAGIETTLCDAGWIEGMNRMDLTLTSSTHSKKVLGETTYDVQNKQTGEKSVFKTNKPIEVLFEGVDTEVYNSKKYNKDSKVVNNLNEIKETFCFLFVGHWLQGEHNHDRKNIGGMIESFLNTFRTQRMKPALIIKTQAASSSIMDQEEILNKIDFIRKKVGGSLPNIYLLHGELSDSEINDLYNHPKIKAMVNLTRGEGFGRPLLEFTTTGKPILASAWSGHTDFLRSDLSFLVGGKLEQIHSSAVVQKMLLPESKWFTFDPRHAKDLFKFIYKKYNKAVAKSRTQKNITFKHYTFEKMQEELNKIVEKYVPFFPEEHSFKPVLPTKIELPKRPINK
jgi:glycosyltransferase involved in cell wall biosynthesis